ncbi:MAG: CoA transferase [Chloroflexi bacterium]|nr:CoA transferase [Chloroflexota bacterium]
MPSLLVSENPPKRYGNAHANIVPYQTFATTDGWIALSVGNDSQFQKLCDAAGCAELAADERFATNPARVAHRVELTANLSAIFAQRTREEWLRLLNAAKVPHGAINSVPQALAHPQAIARAMVQYVPHPTAGEIKLVAPPARFSSTSAQIQRHPPLLGEHTDEVLRELGFADRDLAHLRATGAI